MKKDWPPMFVLQTMTAGLFVSGKSFDVFLRGLLERYGGIGKIGENGGIQTVDFKQGNRSLLHKEVLGDNLV